ncbi:acyltransferase family protein [Pedobacter psychroterrae]
MSKNYLSWKTSFILDILRLLAALVVFLTHGYTVWYKSYNFFPDLDLAHFSVVTFFVLSGYVISYTTTKNNRGAVHYAQARLSRLYSVLLPAILFTAIIQIIIYYINPSVYSKYSNSSPVVRYFISILCLNDIWFFSSSPKLNAPLWSLSYEFWYYVIFGAWFYRKNRGSYLLLAFACLIAGPSILSMMPIWLLGRLAYKLSLRKAPPKSYGLVFATSIAIAIVLLKYLPALPFQLGQPPFNYANQFIKDIILGLFLSVALYSVTETTKTNIQPAFLDRFRKVANLTFPLYLFHFPLLALWQAVFPVRSGDIIQFWIAMISILVIIVPIALFLENKRKWWDRIFDFPIKTLRKIFKRSPARHAVAEY